MMLRQVSSRSQRGKGNLKLQNVLQISLLVAFCIWLLYQMEHSHDKKKSSPKIIKSKVDRSPFDIVKLSRKYGVGEGGTGDHGMDGMSPGEASAAFEEKDHEEAFQKAREMSFKGDDASSEVVHIVHEEEEEEEEGGSHEARERSFKADDASSAVAHVPRANELDPQPGNGGIRNQAENGSENSEGHNSIIVRERSKTIHNSNATEGERKSNSTVLSKKNSTSRAAGMTVLQNKTVVAVAIGDGLNRTEAHGDGKLNFEKGVKRMMQKADDTIGRIEKSEEM